MLPERIFHRKYFSEGIFARCTHLPTLTPGTLTIDARGRPALLYVHVLSFTDEASAVADVGDLERRAVRAFGTAEDVDRVCGTPAPPVAPEEAP